jgi:Mg2+-importing ATPase
MHFLSKIISALRKPANKAPEKVLGVPGKLLESAQTDIAAVLQALHSEMNGLNQAEAEARLKQYGPNEVAREKRKSILARLIDNVKNPLVILLSILGLISYLTGDMRATVVIMIMVLLGVVLRFSQEWRSDIAAEKLKAMVSISATVIRDGEKKDVHLKDVVPGDIVLLSAGDIIPADLRLISAHDLYINQAALTGESLPVEKSVTKAVDPTKNPFEIPNICFLGSSVQVGSATAVAILTGRSTYFGSLAASILGERELTSFDKGVNQFTWLMIKFIAVMVPLVFLLNGLSKGNWLEAFLFAMAVAVGLTPEMLPMIVTVNLSKGAISMSRKKVIVKRLNAIQNFGAMDVLCTDKTGTLTQGKVVLIKHLDVDGNDREEILNFAYVNSFFETGLKNLMDVAVLEHKHLEKELIEAKGYKKIDEIPFDFERRRLSVVVEDNQNRHILICKGAVEETIALSTRIEIQGKVFPIDYTDHHAKTIKLVRELNEQGFRVVALAYKEISEVAKEYTVADEADMILLGLRVN